MVAALQWVAVIASGVAAILWARAAFITVPNNLDRFITELQRAGRWNAAGALAACVAFASSGMAMFLAQ